jgi:CDP-diacylglycerol---glycerol-3-phosphate 3-phosphatidyltransferase
MPSVYQLKPRFLALLAPLTARLAHRGVTANQVTSLACLLSILYGGILCGVLLCQQETLARWLWLGLPLFLFIRMALNAIDGQLARDYGQKSRLGGLLNEMGDVLADAALFVPLALMPGLWAPLIALFIWLALMTEYAGVAGLLIGGGRRYEGPMGKSDRATLVGACGLALGSGLLGDILITGVNILLLLACALMIWTCYNRLRMALSTTPTV